MEIRRTLYREKWSLCSNKCLQQVSVKWMIFLVPNAFFFDKQLKWGGVGWDWVHLVLWTLFGPLYQPRMIDDDECEVVGGMRIGRGNRSTQRKPAPVPLCPQQIPHDLTWARTWVAVVRSRRQTVWAMARPKLEYYLPYPTYACESPPNTEQVSGKFVTDFPGSHQNFGKFHFTQNESTWPQNLHEPQTEYIVIKIFEKL
jgi:hypothetical protein